MSPQAERVFSWMAWLLKKEGFVCQENPSGKSVKLQLLLKDSLEL